MKVVAIAKGYYGDKIREAGEEFEISEPAHLGKWMKEVAKAAPAPVVEKPAREARGRGQVTVDPKVDEEVM